MQVNTINNEFQDNVSLNEIVLYLNYKGPIFIRFNHELLQDSRKGLHPLK